MINKNSFIYWFRNDLRIVDQPALLDRLTAANQCLFVYIISTDQQASPAIGQHRLPFARMSPLRQQYLRDSLLALDQVLRLRGSQLLILHGEPATLLPPISQAMGGADILCEEIAAPEEQQQVIALRATGVEVTTHWQSSLLAIEDLPWEPRHLPSVFTEFRQQIERHALQPAPCKPRPGPLPELPAGDWPAASDVLDALWPALPANPAKDITDHLAAGALKNPYLTPDWQGGTISGQRHLQRYFGSPLPATYKATRNQLLGMAFSTRLSPWLANGAISPRQAYEALQQHEAQHGANESTYWIWFELLWRDYFRCLHLKEGKRLYRYHGLAKPEAPPVTDATMLRRFAQWQAGETGHTLIDAGMRELSATGWLSNRLRQNVASFWIHDLQGDWRLGAAWFEHCLVDFDIYSNQGNWLYIAGKGTDPRGGRRFNPDKQAKDYDPDGRYRDTWAPSVTPIMQVEMA